ncbi:MAG: alpha/beta hydrolase [Flavobacteriales bacterium]|nr:MAG: alpha/beta hydrolase [Flavobacteriales bacterium]
MQLHYKKYGNGEQPFIILHGLLGMLDNWNTIGKQLPEHFCVYLIDQRNHGRSPYSDEHCYQAMVDDLLEFVDENNLQEIILIGHSMGGKTAMKFAQNHPEYVQKLVVVDIGPKYYPIKHDDLLKGIQAVDLNIVNSRKQAEKILEKYIADFAERQFLLRNLYWIEKGKLAWRFNLQAIAKNIENIGEETNDRMFGEPTLFIRGEKSDYILEKDIDAISLTFPNAEFVTIKKAGHWVHAENPQVFLEELLKFIR